MLPWDQEGGRIDCCSSHFKLYSTYQTQANETKTDQLSVASTLDFQSFFSHTNSSAHQSSSRAAAHRSPFSLFPLGSFRKVLIKQGVTYRTNVEPFTESRIYRHRNWSLCSVMFILGFFWIVIWLSLDFNFNGCTFTSSSVIISLKYQHFTWVWF